MLATTSRPVTQPQFEVRYKDWGEQRATGGTVTTSKRYTNQVDDGIGLYFYNARFYDSALGRFVSADSVVPNTYDPQDWDRYSYVHNSPINFTDPTGHDCEAERGWLDEPCGSGANLEGPFVTSAVSDNPAEDGIGTVTTANIPQQNSSNVTSEDLYAFGGSTTGPRAPRAGTDIPVNGNGNVVPQQLPNPMGASSFGDVNNAPLTGPYWKIPSGTDLPDGLQVVADGVDVVPNSTLPETHHTIFPVQPMSFEDFVKFFLNLPWELAGKKR